MWLVCGVFDWSGIEEDLDAALAIAAVSRGVARIERAEDTLVAFATQPNRVASDGSGRNSPFTAALLKHIATPGLEARGLA